MSESFTPVKGEVHDVASVIRLLIGQPIRSRATMEATCAWDASWRMAKRSANRILKSPPMFTVWAIVVLLFARGLVAQKTVSFPTTDGGVVYSDVYGEGSRGVVLAHGGQFNKESWKKQARVLAGAGYRVLAIDFRGYGPSHGPGQSDPMSAPFYFDVLAAIRYLRRTGAQTVSIVGASLGGWAAADASIMSAPGEVDRIVFLGSSPIHQAEKLRVRSLFIVARDDTSGDGPRLPGIRAQFEKTPEPKELIIVDGSAHAQFLFQTEQGDKVMGAILRFLCAP